MTDCDEQVVQKVVDIISKDVSKIRFMRKDSYPVEFVELDTSDLVFQDKSPLPRSKHIYMVYPVDENRTIFIHFSASYSTTFVYATIRTRRHRFRLVGLTFSYDEQDLFRTYTCGENTALYKVISTAWIKVRDELLVLEAKEHAESCKSALEALA